MENEMCVIEVPIEGEVQQCIVLTSFELNEQTYICLSPLISGTVYFFRYKDDVEETAITLSEIKDEEEYQKVIEYFIKITEGELNS